jgi:hypothetical protein
MSQPADSDLVSRVRRGVLQQYRTAIEPVQRQVLYAPGDPGYKAWIGGDRILRCNGTAYDVKYGFPPTEHAIRAWSTMSAKTTTMTTNDLKTQLNAWHQAVDAFQRCVVPISYTMPAVAPDGALVATASSRASGVTANGRMVHLLENEKPITRSVPKAV